MYPSWLSGVQVKLMTKAEMRNTVVLFSGAALA